ncbi:MAG: ribosomal protein S18-alanine N-acetyltransferase [Methylophilaceae bacterium]
MSAMLKPDYQLRPMQAEDLDQVMQIEPTIYSHPWTRVNFADSLNAGHSAWVLVLQNQTIGYALMMLVLDEAQLLNISVAKSYQKQGWGRVLLEHMIEKSKQYKATNMFLEVRTSNISAIALYEKMGFNEMSIRRNYYPAHNGREDAIMMGLAI